MTKRISKSLVVNGDDDRDRSRVERGARTPSTKSWSSGCGANNLSGVLIRRNENVAWLTGGAVEVARADALRNGRRVAAGDRRRASATTSRRRMKPRACTTRNLARSILSRCCFPGTRTIRLRLRAKLAGGPLGSDTPGPDLTPGESVSAACVAERDRNRALSLAWAQRRLTATVESLHQVEPGLSEYDLEALTAANLLRRGILPSVYLFAVDDRIYKYKHAVARGKRLKKYGMLNLCSRKWGLAISITRFVHFGELPAELDARFKSAAQVNAALLDATRVGATSARVVPRGAGGVRSRRIPGRRAVPSPGRSDRLRRARVGCDSRTAKRPSSTTRHLHGIRASAAARRKTR